MRFLSLVLLCFAMISVCPVLACPSLGRANFPALTCPQDRPASPPRLANAPTPGGTVRQTVPPQSGSGSSTTGGTRIRGRSIVRLVILAIVVVVALGGFLVKLVTGNTGKS